MKISQRGPADGDLAKLVQNDKRLSADRRVEGQASETAKSSKINISDEARQLQRIAELARKGDDLRSEKVKSLKEKIDKGEYRPDAEDLAKDIVRAHIARLFDKKYESE